MNRYNIMFQKLSLLKEGCLVPFVVIGDPSIEISIKIIKQLINYGADALEIGIPFSDPLADGPTIQKANLRALSHNYTLFRYFKELKKIRNKYPKIPIGILLYANLIYNQGVNNFYLQCLNSGLDSVLIADVPIEESKIFYRAANQYNIDSIFICPPDSEEDFLYKISLYAQSYIYLLSRPGVTGSENATTSISTKFINNIKKYTSLPLIQGFGISNGKQVKQSISSGSSGVICGSAIINIIERYLHQTDKMLFEIKIFIKTLKKFTKITL